MDAGREFDGVMLQRFSSELADAAFFQMRNQVTTNVRSGAEKYGRVFSIMYDISGANAATLLDDLRKDWSYLVKTLKVTESDRYQRHRGKPLLAIWGLGFTDRPLSAAQSQAIIDYFKTGAPLAEQVTLLGGVPADWRTLSGDSKTDPAFANVYRSFDVLSPWTVGRYIDTASVDAYTTSHIVPDLSAGVSMLYGARFLRAPPATCSVTRAHAAPRFRFNPESPVALRVRTEGPRRRGRQGAEDAEVHLADEKKSD